MVTIDVQVYYLEMLARPERTVPPPRAGLTVMQARRCSVRFYRFLYDAVGRDYHWLSRRKLSDSQLAAILDDPRDEVHVLYVEGTPAGFVELDRRIENEVEIVQFGLMPEFIGQGLGKYFLGWTMQQAWSYGPRRVWLHTCSLDHPAALPNYQNAGFKLYRKEIIRREL